MSASSIKIGGESYRVLEWVSHGLLVDCKENTAKYKGRLKIMDRESKADMKDDAWFSESLYRLNAGYLAVGRGNKSSHYNDISESKVIGGRAVILLSDFDDFLEYLEYAGDNEVDIRWTTSANEWLRFACQRRLEVV